MEAFSFEAESLSFKHLSKGSVHYGRIRRGGKGARLCFLLPFVLQLDSLSFVRSAYALFPAWEKERIYGTRSKFPFFAAR